MKRRINAKSTVSMILVGATIMTTGTSTIFATGETTQSIQNESVENVVITESIDSTEADYIGASESDSLEQSKQQRLTPGNTFGGIIDLAKENFTFKNGPYNAGGEWSSQYKWTNMTEGTMTVTLDSTGDGVVSFYDDATGEVGSRITCKAGKTTTINLTNFNPSHRYYIKVSGKYAVTSGKLVRTK